jgi:hypothetical protein
MSPCAVGKSTRNHLVRKYRLSLNRENLILPAGTLHLLNHAAPEKACESARVLGPFTLGLAAKASSDKHTSRNRSKQKAQAGWFWDRGNISDLKSEGGRIAPRA